MTITITGGSGFLGSAMRTYWEAQGHVVRDIGSLRLGDPVPDGLFHGGDCVVHAAHDFSSGADARNREGTIALFEAARAAGVSKQVFVSSYNARRDAPGVYGACKFAIEEAVAARGATIVRPGLVAGPGGMFARLARGLLRWRTAPVVDADSATVAVISLTDFLAAITNTIERPATPWNLFHPRLMSAREFARTVWSAQGLRGYTIPIAPRIALAALNAVGAAGLHDSVRAQIANRDPVHRSNLLDLVPNPQDPRDAVADAARQVSFR